MSHHLDHFREIWSGDFEFGQPDGELPTPRCAVFREHRSGRLVRLWLDDQHHDLPIPVGDDVLFVAYHASAELNCFRRLGWELPHRVLDLSVEFRRITNGNRVKMGAALTDALTYFGHPSIDVQEKKTMRELAIRGGPYSALERHDLLDYCQSDVDALDTLLTDFLPHLADRRRLSQALLRGRYVLAVSAMETRGVPLDVETRDRLCEQWDRIKTRVCWEVNKYYRVYVPSKLGRTTPETKQGRAILATAQRLGISATHLAEATFEIIGRQESEQRQLHAAILEARRRTGLTFAHIHKWEDAGHDYASWPRLDVTARELAGEFPELGLGGPGYVQFDKYEHVDYAANLWQVLRKPTPPIKPDFDAALDEATLYVDTPFDADMNVRLNFSQARFADWLIRNNIPWPRLETGGLDLDKETFREQAKAHPEVATLHELRETLSTLNLYEKLAVGKDSRNRCMLSQFSARSSRNTPSNSKFIFGPHVWVRGLIKPPPGWAVAYIDWAQQEIAIGAALSQDQRMMEAYASGDFYMAFAIQCGEAPPYATPETHGDIRALYKRACLGMQYRMGEKSLAEYLGVSTAMARRILNQHRETYHRYWQWSQEAIDSVMLAGSVETVFGWPLHVSDDPNPRSIANHPCQGNGAEMMRLAACLMVERGVRVCCPIHDAFLIEAPEDEIEAEVEAARAAMRDAALAVLNGFEVRTEYDIFRYPDRYMDEKRGRKMWDKVMEILDEMTAGDVLDEQLDEAVF